MRHGWILTVLLAFAGGAHAELRGEEVAYGSGDTTFEGWLVWDDAVEGRRPGVLVVHEWWGHGPYVRERARMLAELGYTALAVDMYGDGRTAEHPEDAGAFSSAVMESADHGRARFLAARALLAAHPTVDGTELAAIGYCFGGGVVLTMARAGVELAGVASFHGSLASPVTAEPGAVRARVLVLHGGADEFVPAAQIGAFAEELAASGAGWTFVSYPGVLHSFTNPEADAFAERFGLPLAYDAEADADSWARLETFLAEVFAD